MHADAAWLRQHMWLEHIITSAAKADMTEPIPPEMQHLIEVACYAP